MKRKMSWTGAALFVAILVFMGACKKEPVAPPADAKEKAAVTNAVVATPNIVFTLAGNGIRGTADGLATSAQFTEVDGIAVDVSGAVYVADHDRIRVILHPRATPLPPVTQ